jgi:hypothetical protein
MKGGTGEEEEEEEEGEGEEKRKKHTITTQLQLYTTQTNLTDNIEQKEVKCCLLDIPLI